MWVESQDGRCFVNAIAFQINYYRNNYIIEAITNEGLYPVGKYKTQKRALEVLDESQDSIARRKKLDYQMPKK